MIGRYLATLTTKQEDAVLTERLAYAPRVIRDDGCRCLVGVTEDWQRTKNVGGLEVAYPRDAEAMYRRYGRFEDVGSRFDQLCQRFGDDRINAAIRNRILNNQAVRALAHVKEEAVV